MKWPAVAATCVLLLAASHAEADPQASERGSLHLSWVRGATAIACPDAAELQKDVEQRLGWSPFARGPASGETIEALVTKSDSGWKATIEMRGADGTSMGSRTVESDAPTCVSIAAAAGLAIALMIEPWFPKPSEAAPAAPVVPAAPPSADNPQPLRVKEPVPQVPSKPQHYADGGFDIGAVGAARMLPRFALGITMTGELRVFDRIFGVVTGSFFPTQRLARSNVDVDFGMTSGSIGPCYRTALNDTWTVSGCAALMLGVLQITVSDPQPVAPGERLWWAAIAGLRLGWHAGVFEGHLGADAFVHFAHHDYVLDAVPPAPATSLFVEPSVGALVSLGLGVRY